MTDAQSETSEMVAPQDETTLPKQPCDGTCGHGKARQIAIMANCLHEDLQNIIWGAGQLDVHSRECWDMFLRQMLGKMRKRINTVRTRMDDIERLLAQINAERQAGEHGVETIMEEGGQPDPDYRTIYDDGNGTQHNPKGKAR